MKPRILTLCLPVLVLMGCESDLESAGSLALAAPAFEEPSQTLADDPSETLPEETAPVAEEAFVAEVEHPYFPLRPGAIWIYEGVVDGSHRRDEVQVLDQTRVIADATCTTVMQEVFLDGELAEVTTEWFAQDGAGNVWKFGEETGEFDGVVFRATDESWVAGEAGFSPWIFLPAEPRVGDKYIGHRPGGRDTLEILSLTATADVPAGTFLNCLEAEEEPDDVDDPDIILFAPNVGLVSETGHNGRMELISFR